MVPPERPAFLDRAWKRVIEEVCGPFDHRFLNAWHYRQQAVVIHGQGRADGVAIDVRRQAFDQSALSDAERADWFDKYFAVFPWDRLPADAQGFDAGCGSGRWALLAAPRDVFGVGDAPPLRPSPRPATATTTCGAR